MHLKTISEEMYLSGNFHLVLSWTNLFNELGQSKLIPNEVLNLY